MAIQTPNQRKRQYLLRKAVCKSQDLLKNRARELQQTAERQETSDTSAATQMEQSAVKMTNDAIELADRMGKGVYRSYKNQQAYAKNLKICKQQMVQGKSGASLPAKSPRVSSGQSVRVSYIKQARKNQMIQQSVNRYFIRKNHQSDLFRKAMPEIRPVPMRGGLWKQQIQHGMVRGLKQIAKKIQSALVALTRMAVHSLFRILAAGWVVLLLLLVIGAVAALLGSPMGILLADESTDPNAIPVAIIVQQTNQEFVKAIQEAIAEYPNADEVELQYRYPEGKNWTSYWPEVLALFAVDTNLRSDTDVVVIDRNKKQQIQAMFWEMNRIETSLEQQEIVLPEQDNSQEHPLPGPAVTYRYILRVTISSKSVEQIAAEKNFTQQETELLWQLLSPEMRPTLETMCGDAALPEMEWEK